MPFTFNREQSKIVIAVYERYPDVYNVQSENYKNRNKRQIMLQKITDEVNEQLGNPGVSVEDVKKKINGLRTQFFTELGKIKKSQTSGAGANEIYKPQLWCWELLYFLKDSSQMRKGESNLVMDENDAQSVSN